MGVTVIAVVTSKHTLETVRNCCVYTMHAQLMHKIVPILTFIHIGIHRFESDSSHTYLFAQKEAHTHSYVKMCFVNICYHDHLLSQHFAHYIPLFHKFQYIFFIACKLFFVSKSFLMLVMHRHNVRFFRFIQTY